MASPGTIAIAATIAGVSTHLGYLKRGEYHLYGTRYIQLFTAVLITAMILLARVSEQPLREAIGNVVLLAIFYLLGLYSSLLVYRAFFHPLNSFPGPFGNKLGNLWFSAKLGKADAYKQIYHLHQKYGSFVRVGSSDLSITHPKAVDFIYGRNTKCDRAAFYNGDPLPSMISCRDRGDHDRRRRIWSPAFSDKALRGYAQRAKVYDDQLMSRIHTTSSSRSPMNVSKWFNYYSFDVMGDLAFGKSFDMLKNDQEHWAVALMNTGLEALSFLFPIWLFRVLISVPGLLRDHARIVEYCNTQLDNRMKVVKFSALRH